MHAILSIIIASAASFNTANFIRGQKNVLTPIDIFSPNAPMNSFSCATGPMGALEQWKEYHSSSGNEYYVQINDQKSQWNFPCQVFSSPVPLVSDKQPGYTHVLLATDSMLRRQKQQKQNAIHYSKSDGTSIVKNYIEKHQYDEKYHQKFPSFTDLFNFTGKWDHLGGVIYLRGILDGADQPDAIGLTFSRYDRDRRKILPRPEHQEHLILAAEKEVLDSNGKEDTVNKDLSSSWLDLGTLYISNGHVSLTINAFRRAIQWHDSAFATYHLAKLLSHFGYADDSCAVMANVNQYDGESFARGCRKGYNYSYAPIILLVMIGIVYYLHRRRFFQ